MVRAGLGVLDKFYALPDLPACAMQNRRRAMAARHAWAAAVYGEGRARKTKAQMKEAARNDPASITSGRFLQSLIYSRSDRPRRGCGALGARLARQSARRSGCPQGTPAN